MSFPILFPIDPGAVPTTQEVPGQLEGLTLWYRSDNVVLTNGTEILQWPDLSGNGYNLSAPTVGQRPEYFTDGTLLNARPYISGSGATDCLATTGFTELNGLAGMTLFVVSDRNGASIASSQVMMVLPLNMATTPFRTNIDFFYNSSVNPLSILFHAESSLNGFSSSTVSSAQATLTVPCIYAVSIDRTQAGGTGVRVYNAGALLTLGQIPASNTFVAGNLGFNTGIIIGAQRTDGFNRNTARNYEFILYNRVLSTIERNQVHQYLSTRYNIPVVP